MRSVRFPIAAMVIGSVIAACGGATTPTASPGAGAATQAPADGTAAPGATSDDGGGDLGGGGVVLTANGSLHLEISGPAQKSGDFGFAPAGSIFGGASGSSINFISQDGNEVVSVLIAADQSVVVSYGSPDFAVPGATCKTSNWNIGASSASGSFECDNALVIDASGGQHNDGTMKGNLDVHQ